MSQLQWKLPTVWRKRFDVKLGHVFLAIDLQDGVVLAVTTNNPFDWGHDGNVSKALVR